jgi:hypothetical protein
MPADAADSISDYITATHGGTIEFGRRGSFHFVCESGLTDKTFCASSTQAIVDLPESPLEVSVGLPYFTTDIVTATGFYRTVYANGANVSLGFIHIYNDNDHEENSSVIYAENGATVVGMLRGNIGNSNHVNWDNIITSLHNSVVRVLAWGAMRQKTSASSNHPMFYAGHGGLVILADLINGSLGADYYKGTNGVHAAALNTGRLLYGAKANNFDGGSPDVINGDVAVTGFDTGQGTYINAIQDASWS